MHLLETRIPPPLVMLLCGLAGWALGGLLARWPLPVPAWAAVSIGVLGLLLNLLPKWTFGRVRTTVNPLRPTSTTVLVTSGIYRYSRNPMYLGQALVLLGAMLLLRNALALLVVPLFVAWITRLQIVPEERALAARFGARYEAFRSQVRRWL
ncbi:MULTISPECIES: isoprenylcysteine carboxylmethyltransferase family protein [Stenotrophomonas]|uniref:methyltransferase family protein n=1 Tax=Stenotrophomonas TaxID=40323 RepID=UPI000D53D9D6|nr:MULTISPECIES: isoprenylcysteine carboxylmethyltransferase family protein [Stenotrophomonas]AWH23468.1 protein-S-isoprenylcysteine methyltransferase [Stenotrophomonas sp. ZAC14D2_NAIMI4_6]